MSNKIPTSKAKTAYGLLSEVIRLILAEPLRYHQRTYIERKGVENGLSLDLGFPSCNTVGCVAGWIATLKGRKDFTYNEAEPIASKILGPDVDTDRLFAPWAVGGKPQTPEHAQRGAEHIRRFQQKNRAALLQRKLPKGRV